MSPRDNEHVLRDVLAQREILSDRKGDSGDRTMVTLDEPAEARTSPATQAVTSLI